jgi:hypothetical protein
MKIILPPSNYNFNPAFQIVDFDPMLGVFDPQRLLAIVNVTTGGLVYSTASNAAGYGGVFSGGTYPNSILTFNTSAGAMTPTDILQVFYDDASYITTTDLTTVGGSPVFLGQNTLTDSIPVAIASNQTDVPTTTNITKYGGVTTALGQNLSANSIPVVLASNQSTVPVNVTNSQSITVKNTNTDILGVDITGQRYNQVEVTWTTSVGNGTINSTTGGSITSTLGHTIFSLGNTGTSALAFTQSSITYRPGHEMYAMMTAAWTDFTGDAVTNARLGLYNSTTDGFAIGYQLGSFGIFKITNSVTTFVARGLWNTDLLTGAVGSKFTSNGTPVAIDLTKSNLFRIRFAWLGSANIFYEVLSPDNNWVLFHNIRQPNSDYNPSLTTPNLTMRLDMTRAAGTYTNAPAMATACWAGGTTSNLVRMDSTILPSSLVTLNRTVIEGVTTAGGGSYIPVKVTPSGSLTTDSTVSSIPDLMVTSATAIWSTGQNMLLTASGSAGTDVTGYKSGSVQVVTSAGTTGNWIFEGSNNNTNWQSSPVFNLALANPPVIVTAISAVASSSIVYSFPIRTRYIRLRAGATTTANVTCFTRLSQDPFVPPVQNMIQPTAANLLVTASIAASQTLSTVSTVSSVTSAFLGTSETVDLNAQNIATTGQGSAVVISNISSYAFQPTVTFTSGTGSVDITVEESADSGNSWTTLYAFDRITASGAGTFRQTSPVIRASGNRIRWTWTTTGTVVGTSTATRLSRSASNGLFRRAYDRTLTPNGSTPSASIFSEGCEYSDVIVSMAAGGTGPTIQVQGSEDGTNWYSIGSTFVATAGTTTAFGIADGTLPKLLRASVSAAGTGSTLNYVVLKCKGA